LLVLVPLAAYLVGAVPFGYLVARAKGIDIMRHGSGNIGATNVGRVLGRRWGILVFVLDFAKGAVPVAVARFALPQPEEAPPDTLPVLAGVAAFVGHLFPVYLGFKGGKGVATGAGVVAVLVPWLTLAVFAAWAVVLLTTHYMSLASMTAAVLLIGLRLAVIPEPFGESRWVVTTFCLVGGVLVIAKHHGNIRRLLAGTEGRLFTPRTRDEGQGADEQKKGA
jgi:acyl-phosphate glycerol 3-phosphate acyltransferase